MGRSVTGSRDRRHDRIAEFDHVSIGELNMFELDARVLGQICGRSRPFDERRQPRDVISLNVGLENCHDRRSDCLRCLDVTIDQVDMGVDDRELV